MFNRLRSHVYTNVILYQLDCLQGGRGTATGMHHTSISYQIFIIYFFIDTRAYIHSLSSTNWALGCTHGSIQEQSATGNREEPSAQGSQDAASELRVTKGLHDDDKDSG